MPKDSDAGYFPLDQLSRILRPQHSRPSLPRRSTPALRVTALVSLVATLMLTASGLARATTINAKSASFSDVAAAIASAADGDTVTIPGGTASWTRTLQVKRGITIQGAGVGVTVVKDAVQSGQLINVTLVGNNLTRITGIEFQDGGRTGRGNDGILRVTGSNTDGSTFRWDNCKWNNMNGPTTFETVIGVIDHVTFVLDRAGSDLPINIYGSAWDGYTLGDGSWTAPSGYGSCQFLFIEDCTFTHGKNHLVGMTDSYAGGRFVVRHSTIVNGTICNHGTESTGRARGARAMEVYNNVFTGTNLNRFIGGVRSGGVLFHDNTVSGYWKNSAEFTLQNFRNFHPFNPWGGADGTNAWDVNSGPYFTGTAAADNSGTTVTVSGANWTTNRWAGYTVRRLTDICNSGTINFSWIMGNTSNTITYAGNAVYPKEHNTSFCAGDSLEIRKIDHALDQPGSAGGSLITGDRPVRPAGWNNQVTEPCYSWNNRNELNGQVNFSAGPGVRANEHYFNNTPMPGYTPYVYPHPLTKGLPPPKQMTQNAKGNSQHNLRMKRQPWGGKKLDREKAKKAKESPTNETIESQDNRGN